MNNLSLYSAFAQIYNMGNAFDKELALKAFKKEYHQSDFYKNTHYSLRHAYNIFCSTQLSNAILSLEELSNVDNWINKANDFISGIDQDKIDNLIDQIVASLDVKGLQMEKEQLQDLLTKIQK